MLQTYVGKILFSLFKKIMVVIVACPGLTSSL
jgi:hypothetical protein